MSVSATDADDPTTENAILSYSIIGQESVPPNAVTKVMFGINNETGTIYTRDVGLDREVQTPVELKARISAAQSLTEMSRRLSQVVKSFRLRLQIADMSGQGLTSEGVAIIHVSDINNHAPQFRPSSVSPGSISHRRICTAYSRLLRLLIAVQFHGRGKQEAL